MPGQGAQMLPVVILDHVAGEGIFTRSVFRNFSAVLPCSLSSLEGGLFKLVIELEGDRAAFEKRLPRMPVELHLWRQWTEVDPAWDEEHIAHFCPLKHYLHPLWMLHPDSRLLQCFGKIIRYQMKGEASGFRKPWKLRPKDDTFSILPHDIRLIILKEVKRLGAERCSIRIASRVMLESYWRYYGQLFTGGDLTVSVEWAKID